VAAAGTVAATSARRGQFCGGRSGSSGLAAFSGPRGDPDRGEDQTGENHERHDVHDQDDDVEVVDRVREDDAEHRLGHVGDSPHRRDDALRTPERRVLPEAVPPRITLRASVGGERAADVEQQRPGEQQTDQADEPEPAGGDRVAHEQRPHVPGDQRSDGAEHDEDEDQDAQRIDVAGPGDADEQLEQWPDTRDQVGPERAHPSRA